MISYDAYHSLTSLYRIAVIQLKWFALVVSFLVGVMLGGALTIFKLAGSHSYGGPIQNVLIRLQPVIENRIPQAIIGREESIQGIVVLGGNTSRVEAALDLLVRYPNARAIFSGPRFNEEQLIRQFHAKPGRITIDNRAQNTFENAQFSQELADPDPGERWLLVTSALHMPRAFGTFMSNGFCIAPWKVYDAQAQPHITAPVIVRELLGLLFYYMLGRTVSYFPGVCNDYTPKCVSPL